MSRLTYDSAGHLHLYCCIMQNNSSYTVNIYTLQCIYVSLHSIIVQSIPLLHHQSPSFVQLCTTAHPPGPPRNLTFNFYLDFESNTFKGNATWQGPEMPEGKLIEYRYVLSSVAGRTIVGGTISVEVCVSALARNILVKRWH